MITVLCILMALKRLVDFFETMDFGLLTFERVNPFIKALISEIHVI